MNKRTNIELDVELLEESMKVTNFKSIKELVNHSLKELVKLNRRRAIFYYKGNVKWAGDLNEMRENG